MSNETHSIGENQAEPPASRPIRATVYVGRWPTIPAVNAPGTPKGRFSPTTSTIISGATEAILIDTQYLKDDVRDLGDLIERTGKKLTTIYITHGHADHYLGCGPLLARFPDARCVALPTVVEDIKQSMEFQAARWAVLFGDACVKGAPVPESLGEIRTLYVDGSAVHVIEVKQADINPTSIVHVPAIDAVVAGDAIYNEIHQMLGLSTPAQWQDWLDTVDIIEKLNPRMIVAGHRRPDGDDYAVKGMITQTRSYIEAFAQEYAVANNADDLIAAMTVKYPMHGNRWTLKFSAINAVANRDAGGPTASSNQ